MMQNCPVCGRRPAAYSLIFRSEENCTGCGEHFSIRSQDPFGIFVVPGALISSTALVWALNLQGAVLYVALGISSLLFTLVGRYLVSEVTNNP